MRVPLREAVRRVLSGELLDGKTMLGILLCFHRLAVPGRPQPQLCVQPVVQLLQPRHQGPGV